MPFNFDQDYKLNQIRHQQKIDDAKRERDIREANGSQVRRQHEWLGHLADHAKELGAAWRSSYRTIQNASKRLRPTLRH